MVKKLIVLMMLCLLLLSSCNKYEEGPALSLRSKNARLFGVWELQESKYTNTTNEGAISRLFNDGILICSGCKYNYSDNSYDYFDTTYSISYSKILKIGNDGAYRVRGENLHNSGPDCYWSWKNPEFTKSHLYLSEEGEYKIIKLTKNELVLESISSLSESTHGIYELSSSGNTYTYSKLTSNQWLDY